MIDKAAEAKKAEIDQTPMRQTRKGKEKRKSMKQTTIKAIDRNK